MTTASCKPWFRCWQVFDHSAFFPVARLLPLLRLLALVLIAGVGCFPALAQVPATGTIEGRVQNARNGAYLNKVRVVVKDSALAATTNDNGEFRLTGVPAGAVTLTVAYTGLEPQTQTIQVAADGVARADFALMVAGTARATGEVVRLAAFTVEERELSAQGAALHEQRAAGNIRNVVSMEEFGDLGITNPGHFLTYVPGVSNVYNTTGEVEGIGIRGMASSGTLVMFDGAQAASNDPASRSYNFSGTSVSNLDRIEITKVPTPDLPANAVGGSINMVSKSGFNRSTPLFRYNVFLTAQAKGTQGGLPPLFSEYAGLDDKTTYHPVQPGFDLGYQLPLNRAVAFTFNLAHNARYQDREYQLATWDRVRLLETGGSMYSVVNIYTKDLASAGVDWKTGRSVFRARADVTLQDAFTRSSIFNYTFGTGATGGPNFTTGAPSGVGSVGQSAGQHVNQYRRLINGRLSHTYSGDVWKFDWTASYSEARRLFSDIDDGFFGTVATSLGSVVVSATGLDGINSMTLPRLTVATRAGAALDPYDSRQYSISTVSTSRMAFKNFVRTAAANATRTFAGGLPFTLKAGLAVEDVERDNWTESASWNFRPPAGGNALVGSYDLIADAFSARRSFNTGTHVAWISTAKAYALYQQHPEYFQFNDVAAYQNRVNNSKNLQETIAAGYLRGDVRAFDNRLWLVFGGRLERTMDRGLGPLNDIRNTYVRNAAGQVVLGANGRPVTVAGDALTLAKLQYQERAALAEKNYQGFYPSMNASYSLGANLVLRTAYARTIGRPDLSFITPGTTISDPAAASPTITVVNTGLQPWTANNYDLTLESYEFRGSTLAVSGFRKEISRFFTSIRVPATKALLSQYGLPEDLDPANYEVITRSNSDEQAIINGLEWSWRQSFRPFTRLPGLVRSLGLFVNATHLRLGGPGAPNFTGYSTRVLNYGVSFTRPNFALKLNATDSNGPITAFLAPSSTSPAGSYTATAPRTITSGSLEYRISPHVTVHLSGQNLSYSYWRSMNYTPGAPAYAWPAQFRDTGVEYVIGLKGEF